jgi:hypothetical protein
MVRKLGLVPYFFEKLPNENKRPMGENSPNLVTLVGKELTKAAQRQRDKVRLTWIVVHTYIHKAHI